MLIMLITVIKKKVKNALSEVFPTLNKRFTLRTKYFRYQSHMSM